MSREVVLYEETYKKGACRVRKELLPDRFPYMNQEARITAIEVRKAGRVTVDGRELEFQDVRVYVDVEGTDAEGAS